MHIVKHDIVKLRGILANLRAKRTHARRKTAGKQYADNQMRDDQQQREPRVEGEGRDREHHRGHHGDDNRRNRVREEDLQQFDISGDQRNQIALALAGKLGRSQSAQRGKGLGPEQRQQAERDIMVHILFRVPHDTAQHTAHDHADHRGAGRQPPHRMTEMSEQGAHAEHRQECRR